MTASARCGALLLALSSLAACSTAEPIDWRDAGRCGGWLCTLSGTVAASSDEGPVIRLYFDPEDHSAYVTLVKSWLVTWPDYVGRRIAAEGRLRHFHGHTEILVRDPSDIELLDQTPTPAAPTATPPLAPTEGATAAPTAPPTAAPTMPPAAMPPAATPGEVEQLRERVRELEDRMRQLEEHPSNEERDP